jgi:hypothetical protein
LCSNFLDQSLYSNFVQNFIEKQQYKIFLTITDKNIRLNGTKKL